MRNITIFFGFLFYFSFGCAGQSFSLKERGGQELVLNLNVGLNKRLEGTFATKNLGCSGVVRQTGRNQSPPAYLLEADGCLSQCVIILYAPMTGYRQTCVVSSGQKSSLPQYHSGSFEFDRDAINNALAQLSLDSLASVSALPENQLSTSGDCAIDGRLKIRGDGTILDSATNLVWGQCLVGQNWNGSLCEKSTPLLMSWVQAMKYAKQQRYLNLSDWRLPSPEEVSAVLKGRGGCISNKNNFMSRALESHYVWSSRAGFNGVEYSWSVGLQDGLLSGSQNNAAVLLVREGELSSVREFSESFDQNIGRPEAEAAALLEQQRLAIEKDRLEKMEKDRQYQEMARQREAENRRIAEEQALSEKKFGAVLKYSDPQLMYLAAVKYESSDETGRAKDIYLKIIDRFSSSPIAIKAADRLTSIQSVERASQAEHRLKQDGCSHLYVGKVVSLKGAFGITFNGEVRGIGGGKASVRSFHPLTKKWETDEFSCSEL
jgi:Protein of unknown function (DUF1566)